MKSTASHNRRQIIIPQEHFEAFKAAADREGISLSEWIGNACLEKLPKRVRSQLPERQGVGRPPGTISEKAEK